MRKRAFRGVGGVERHGGVETMRQNGESEETGAAGGVACGEQ